jgi:hypothetical protein
MLNLFKPGDEVFGYCCGYFGRDDYDDKVCVMVTPKYAVFQNEEGEGTILNYSESRLAEDVLAGKFQEKLDE